MYSTRSTTLRKRCIAVHFNCNRRVTRVRNSIHSELFESIPNTCTCPLRNRCKSAHSSFYMLYYVYIIIGCSQPNDVIRVAGSILDVIKFILSLHFTSLALFFEICHQHLFFIINAIKKLFFKQIIVQCNIQYQTFTLYIIYTIYIMTVF